jgi:hypothetical protein
MSTVNGTSKERDLVDRLAVVQRVDLREILETGLDQVGQAPDHLAALLRRDALPRPLWRAAGRGHGAVHILVAPARGAGDLSPGSRVVDRKALPRGGLHALVFDQHRGRPVHVLSRCF